MFFPTLRSSLATKKNSYSRHHTLLPRAISVRRRYFTCTIRTYTYLRTAFTFSNSKNLHASIVVKVGAFLSSSLSRIRYSLSYVHSHERGTLTPTSLTFLFRPSHRKHTHRPPHIFEYNDQNKKKNRVKREKYPSLLFKNRTTGNFSRYSSLFVFACVVILQHFRCIIVHSHVIRTQ